MNRQKRQKEGNEIDILQFLNKHLLSTMIAASLHYYKAEYLRIVSINFNVIKLKVVDFDSDSPMWAYAVVIFVPHLGH